MGLFKSKKSGAESDSKSGNLSIAYGMKKRAKKYARGGYLSPAEESEKAARSEDQKGVHHDTGYSENSSHGAKTIAEERAQKFNGGVSHAGHKLRDTNARDAFPGDRAKAMSEVKDAHKKVLKESRAINPNLKGLAEGGDVHEDMVDRILSKCMSEGGMVANEQGERADEMPNEFDDLALRDDLDFEYDAANSGDEHGSKLNQEEDMQDRILRKRSAR